MVCPSCGEHTHRSHSRNFRESFVKRFTPLKHYRCRECGWRGLAAPARVGIPRVNQKAVYVWIAGLLFALAVGMFGSVMINDQRSGNPQQPVAPSMNRGR